MKEFRAACDFFFDAKQAHFDEKDKAFEDNLKAKQALIEEIKAYDLPSDKKEAIAALHEFADRFSKVGFVPSKQKDEVFKRSEEHTSELQSRPHLVCRLLLEKKKIKNK